MDPLAIEEERTLDEEIVQFVTGDLAYFAVTGHGMRLDIMRSQSIQPQIADVEDYCTYLWVETVQGFYLLRQRIQGNQPQAWVVIREVVPQHRHNFYYYYLDELRDKLDSAPPS